MFQADVRTDFSLRIGNVLEDICTEGWGDETFLGSKSEKKNLSDQWFENADALSSQSCPKTESKGRQGSEIFIFPFIDKEYIAFLVSGLCCSELAPGIILSCRKSWQGKYIAFSSPLVKSGQEIGCNIWELIKTSYPKELDGISMIENTPLFSLINTNQLNISFVHVKSIY